MNKLLFSFLTIIYSFNLLATSAIAREEPYGGRCLHINEAEEEQAFRRCNVTIRQGNLEINFRQEKYQDGDKTIATNSIFEIASGAYAAQLLSDTGSLVSGILLGPISLVGRIVRPNQDFQQYILQFTNTEGEKDATILNINRSDIAEFQQELSLVTGKLITFREGQTRTTIDIGPNIEDVQVQ